MRIDLLARRWGGPAGGRDGMAIASAFLAWTLAELGHQVRCFAPEGSIAPWEHEQVTWAFRQPLVAPDDWTADLVLSTIAPAWRRTVIAAEQARACGRLVYWHHHGPIPPGYGCTLARCAEIGELERGWARAFTLPPSTWAVEAGGERTGQAILVPGVSRAKGGPTALAVARLITDLPWYVLPGRATEEEVAPWKGLPHVTLAPPGIAPEQFLSQAGLLLSPTRAEVHPLTPLEAAVRGIPVVISDLPGCRFALRDTPVYLAPDAPAESWAQSVRAALEQPPRRLQLPPYAEVVRQALPGCADGAVAPAPAAPAPRTPRRGAPRATEIQRPTRREGDKPRVLLVADVPGWAFDQNLHDLADHLSDRFSFELAYVAGGGAGRTDMRRFDAVFVPYHRWPLERVLPAGRTLGSLRAQWFWPETPATPGPREFELVNGFAGFHVVTQRNLRELQEHCPRVRYLTNPVNLQRFPRATEVRGVVASWNGNARHNSAGTGIDVKGLHSFVAPACVAAGVPLQVAEYHTCRLPPAEMPAFYQRASVAICASLFEGASNSVMEAMASGLAVIATDVGNHRELYDSQVEHLDDAGIMLVDRSIEAIARALRQLEADPERVRAMGQLNRQEIAERWSWEAWADRYADFIRLALEDGAWTLPG